MRLRTLFFVLAALLIAGHHAEAQSDSTTRTSTLRGTVRSAGSPIYAARVKLQGTRLGAVTNLKGEYRIEHVPVGHYVVTVSALDYRSQSQDVIVSSAHQSILDFALEELSIQGDSLTVEGTRSLSAVNSVTLSSVTPFSIEDVNRYAAAFQDPSRMAENFAGVYGRGSTNNYIVVRGGSPIELLWRLDNIDIPNPNHLGKGGTTGGIISAINSAMLGNSDFLTGAFPAKYGTRLSAVFDLHTRNGNTENYESRAEVSFNGLEALTEGPLPGITNGSYLLGYRHSTLAVLKELGILDYNRLPDFDDASLKLHLPVGERDRFDITSLWGTAHLDIGNSADEELGAGSGILVGGLDWQHLFSEQWLSHVYLNYVRNSFTESRSRNNEDNAISFTTGKASVSFTPSSTHTFDVGGSAQRASYGLRNVFGSGTDTTIRTMFYSLFANWNWHLLPQITFNAGLFSQFIAYDSSSSYEPRLSLAWTPDDLETFSVAYGIHRQPEPLKFAQAEHFVAGYSIRPTDDLLFKLEGYLKNYTDVPVHADRRDFFSFQNEGYASTIDFSALSNTGEGRTYGAELTALKHFSSGYFVTATASLVRQEFAGSDGVKHFGAFDNVYILNLVSGYDIALSSSSTLTLGEKFTIAGGGMYTPFDLQRSAQTGREMLDSAHAFSVRNPPYVRLDANIDLRFNWSHTALTVYGSVLNALSIKNVTNRFVRWTDFDQTEVGEDYDIPIIPVLGVRYEF